MSCGAWPATSPRRMACRRTGAPARHLTGAPARHQTPAAARQTTTAPACRPTPSAAHRPTPAPRPEATMSERATAADRLARILYLVPAACRSEEHTSELQSRENLVCSILIEYKK